MAVLDTLVITGSSDGTARVWDLAHNRQQHLLQMPGQEGVVAVALPSVSLAVTATARGGAVLWRAGRAIRRFEPVPVSEGWLWTQGFPGIQTHRKISRILVQQWRKGGPWGAPRCSGSSGVGLEVGIC
jgi:hypothetical protein